MALSFRLGAARAKEGSSHAHRPVYRHQSCPGFYSIGVWSERIQGRLKPWHLAFFGLGLVCDTVGTGLMFEMAGGLTFDVHGLTGLLAIILMLIHAVWAAVVLLRKDAKMIASFHKFSVAVWLIWLVPYLSPMFFRIAGVLITALSQSLRREK